jgi:HSP20 family protein
MSINIYETPFDILVKNFFEADSKFFPAAETKSPHPVDIYETKSGLHLEVACTGLSKEDVEINIENDILKMSYNKQTELNEDRIYQVKGIARRSFNLGYKIASRFDLSKAEAEMKNGLLVISIPFAEEAKPKTLKIK